MSAPSSSVGGSASASPESRYERVKRILNAAQGSVDPSYQGCHRFWELPLPQFLAFELYGVRMIAPPPGAPASAAGGVGAPPPANSGCGCSASSADAGPPASSGLSGATPGRGAASGLIKGLKGEAPFDGSQFPKLPWGGAEVAAEDIAFIEQWIDDGCPPDDKHRHSASVRESKLRALALGHEAHALSAKTLNDHRQDIGGINVRKNVETLDPEELRRLRAAIAQMHTFDDYYQDERSYNYWARIHASNCQHNWEEFLTWHRAYLYNFEKRLQDIDPSITIPYWDWSAYNQNWVADGHADTGDVAAAFHCFVDDGVLAALKGRISDDTLQKLASTKGRTFNSANRLYKAAGIPWTASPDKDPILAALEAANPLWHRFRWPGGTGGPDGTLFENYPRPEDDDHILAIDGWFPFGSGPADDHFFGALENVHNLLHLFTGGPNPNYDAKLFPNPTNRIEPQYGDMFSNSTTTFDPFFWSYHSNVDRMWDLWQQRHPGVGPDDPSAVLPPFNFTVADTYSVKKLGYEYQLDASVFETEPTVSLTRFKSAKADVHPHALANHARAEVRLIGVRYATEGGGVLRVFLNEDDANEKTPTKGNDHYVGQFALFAGGCVGGPGHCMPPSGPKLAYDLRKRHPKTPGNIRLDATEAVRKLRAKGAKDFHIHVLALGPDGRPASDILRLDAVSLNFFD